MAGPLLELQQVKVRAVRESACTPEHPFFAVVGILVQEVVRNVKALADGLAHVGASHPDLDVVVVLRWHKASAGRV